MKLILGGLEQTQYKQQQKLKKRQELWEKNFHKYYTIDNVKSFVAGVKYIGTVDKCHIDDLSYDELIHIFNVIQHTSIMGWMLHTSAKIAELFPPTKTYDGDKYECKDYYSSINAIKEYSKFNKSNDFKMFLYEYYNRDIMNFCIIEMFVINRLRRYQGEQDIITEFFGNELPSHIITIKNNNDKDVLYDVNAKQILKTHKPHRHLKLVK